ncbi:MAG TPA: DUF924 family protein [Rhodanobacteraceae bacterium]|nr:DUF924 family protein [Rhodanobacteraceae bacterium]
MTDTQPHQLVEFWRAAGARRWFARDPGFDAECTSRFADAHHAAARCECEHWLQDPQGALALVILLDQIPRNLFRGSAHAYATDGLARHYALRALDSGFDTRIDAELRVFFYLPFEHSELLADQERSLFLHRALPGENADRWARLHYDIIRRFGRFPHRNAALGRITTPEEQAFLDGGGFAG